MDTICTFQSNDPTLEALWAQGVKGFSAIDPKNMELLAQDTASFAVYVQLCLVLTADVACVEGLLDDMYSYLTKKLEEKSQEAPLASYAYPRALLSYAEYVADEECVKPYYEGAKALVALADQMESDDPITQAHRIGAKLLLQKVAFICKLPFERVSLGREIGQFNKSFYMERQGTYTPAELNYLTAYYGFVSDDGEDTVREYLTEHSFGVLRKDSIYLYGGLYHLEAHDALLSAVLEAGIPSEHDSPALLAGLLALITMLCGVDIPMLAKGIRCMQVWLPEHMAFRMVLSSPDGPIYFDNGELLFDEFSF